MILFLLYDGSSEDGRGYGKYVGYTLEAEKAAAHAKKCRDDPYCTGSVTIITDTSETKYATPEKIRNTQ